MEHLFDLRRYSETAIQSIANYLSQPSAFFSTHGTDKAWCPVRVVNPNMKKPSY